MSDTGVQLQSIHHTQEQEHKYGNQVSPAEEINGKLRHRTSATSAQGYVNPGFSSDNTPKGGVFTISHPNDEVHTDPRPLYEQDLDEDKEPNALSQTVKGIQSGLRLRYDKHGRILRGVLYAILLVLYVAYFGYAMHYNFGDEGSIRLLWVTCVILFFVLVYLVDHFFGEKIGEALSPCLRVMKLHEELISWVSVSILFLGIIIFILVDVFVVSKEPYNLVPASGLFVYVILFYIFSHDPSKVKWRPVVWGLAMQFVFALIILRWDAGYEAFKWLGDRVAEFLAHTDAGSAFVFDDYTAHFFAFAVLPIVIFFSSFISMLYYLGAMQVVIKKIAVLMQVLMGTTAGESINAAGNIFIGQTEAPLLIKPLIGDMTRSELHAVMTGGFATIAGSLLGAYIAFGVPANHLISASVMSAPAALAMSKLFYPETKKSKTTAKDVECMEKSPERNIIEAASAGASTAISLVANIAANLIAFIALKAFLNATLTWFGERVGIFDPPLTFELICSYILYPFAIVMGVDPGRDSRNIARLIGVKTFVNEFVAYTDLGVLMTNKKQFLALESTGRPWEYSGDLDITFQAMPPAYNTTTTLAYGYLTDRSEVIATYALCGFANLGSMGIMLGALGAMAPHRKADLAAIVLRAMIAGNVACFMTACIAGIFYQPEF